MSASNISSEYLPSARNELTIASKASSVFPPPVKGASLLLEGKIKKDVSSVKNEKEESTSSFYSYTDSFVHILLSAPP